MNILDYIPTGKENAITRCELNILTGLTDRNNRELIRKAREGGAIILNLQDGVGYYQSDNLDDIEIQCKIDESRAIEIFKRLKPMRKALKEAGRR